MAPIALRGDEQEEDDEFDEDELLPEPPPPVEWLGHPPGLVVLFTAEMWERMSYYGMRALLVLYLNDVLLQPETIGSVYGLGLFAGPHGMYGDPGDDPAKRQAISSKLYGLYTGLVYLTPLGGGLLADRGLGQRRAVLIGGGLMAFGHVAMAFTEWFMVALGLLIAGNGLFKPNISTQVGRLYEEGDPRRDQAFSIFYAGINLGAMLSPLVCGTLGEQVGYEAGFAAAGVGMCIGLAVFCAGQRWLPPEKDAQEQNSEEPPVGMCATLSAHKPQVGAILIVSLFAIMFWAVYEQQGNTIQLFASQQTDMMLLPGIKLPATWIQSLNPLFILILIPLISKFWGWQAERGTEPSSVAKMAIGSVVSASSYLFLVVAASLAGSGRCSMWWLVLAILVLTLGEIYASPVGLSFVSQASPPGVASFLMGGWFLCTGVGGYMAGEIGALYSAMSKASFFLLVAIIGCVNGTLLALAVGRINRLLDSGSHDAHDGAQHTHSALDDFGTVIELVSDESNGSRRNTPRNSPATKTDSMSFPGPQFSL